MRILILGADGYLGWPTAMQLSERGHEVGAVDNYMRRDLAAQRDLPTLFPVPDLKERVEHWQGVSGRRVEYWIGDICDYAFLKSVFERFRPDTVIHYAEQPSAPYSMLGQGEAQQTLVNNLNGTLNVAYAVKETNPDIHIVKLGTMGEYGTPNIDIEEGFIEIEHKGRKGRFLFPRQAGSLYHTTKIQDTDLLYFYVRAWGLRVTDLMQGPVYGVFTDEMRGDDRLFTCFAYDEVFGTVLNRFVVQAVAGVPLTVYGKGGQTRGYLNIKDTLQCIALATEHPAAQGELRVFNQFTQVFSVLQIAEMVRDAAGLLGLDVTLRNLPNPRVEAEEHYYNPVHHGLRELGLKPHLLDPDGVAEIMQQVRRYENRIRKGIILPKVSWK